MSIQSCLRKAQSSRGILFQCHRYVASTSSAAPPAKKSQILHSSCAADTVLTGLNYLKNQPPILARPDEEYPEWLWTVLRPKELEDDGPGGRKERLERRRENKQKIRERNFMSTQ
ncbi:mitochondrial ribosomal protein L37-domain-containing protein [Rhodocollybia butyracea]|uniref:Large ribosomal subunit protein mL54 n=1 Tax=Rhodocollybia butyracea TaxID=206335 RepID=A0A9P5UCU3_9AGAR|nr:mitochondrial ribosomal protein L37-domain-containing protein [Rhodocollybia butyracea]